MFGHDPSRTEEATARRLEEAQKKGQYARSQELTQGFTLAAALLTIYLGGRWMFSQFQEGARVAFSRVSAPDFDEAGFAQLAFDFMLRAALACLPVVAIIIVVSLWSHYHQVGFVFNLVGLKPSFARLNPLNGIQRFFNMQAVVGLGKALLKILLYGWVTYSVLAGRVAAWSGLAWGNAPAMLQEAATVAWMLGWRFVLLALLIGWLDWRWQKHSHAKQLRMTKQEVKEEHKSSEMPSEVKGKIKGKQRALSMQRISQAVPAADVVVTNPTHFAVALKYDALNMGAPQVVAKGVDHLAAKIKDIAKAHQVPIVENVPLARALYKQVEVGREITPELYAAVSEVLIFVYRLSGRIR